MSTRFVIVGAARTGSTLLVRTLNSLQGVCCHGELLSLDKVWGYQDNFDPVAASQGERDERAARLLRERTQDPVDFIRRALSTHNTATGFKVLHHILLHPRWNEVKASLLANPDIKFIHLSRRNNLRRYISEQILHSGGANHSGAGGKSDVSLKVRVDIDAFLEDCAAVEASATAIGALLLHQDTLDISYEELSCATATTLARVCEFLGLDSVPAQIKPALQKVGAVDLRDSVSNYQELLEHPATRELVVSTDA